MRRNELSNKWSMQVKLLTQAVKRPCGTDDPRPESETMKARPDRDMRQRKDLVAKVTAVVDSLWCVKKPASLRARCNCLVSGPDTRINSTLKMHIF